MGTVEIKNTGNKTRINTLDSLRGFAAVTVVIGHITGGTRIGEFMNATPLYLLRAGHEAVVFFFMLSGYVLVYQFGAMPKAKYGDFLISRFLRLYVPYIAAIALSLWLFRLHTPGVQGQLFISQLWRDKITNGTLIGHFFLIGDFDSSALNPVIWSLVIEMRMSILFPLLQYLLKLPRTKWFTIIMVTTLLAAIAMVFSTLLWGGYYNGYLSTPYFLYVFMLGGVIAKNQSYLVLKYRALNLKTKVLLTLVCVLLYTYGHAVPLLIANSIYIPGLVRSTFLIQDFSVAIASFYFIVAAIAVTNSKNILNKKLPLFLGKISYSLYLVHLPVICFVYFSLNGKLPLPAILTLGVLSAVGLAVLFNRLIEKPVMKLARRVFLRDAAVLNTK